MKAWLRRLFNRPIRVEVCIFFPGVEKRYQEYLIWCNENIDRKNWSHGAKQYDSHYEEIRFFDERDYLAFKIKFGL